MNKSEEVNLYFLGPTESTPLIRIDSKLGIIEVCGVSAPDDPLSFYGHLYTVLSKFEEKELDVIHVKIALKKIVDSKSFLFILIKRLISFSSAGIQVKIGWFYEKKGEEIWLTGQDISKHYNHPFEFKKSTERGREKIYAMNI